MEDHDMDLTKVNVVRSAKGVDMLCVDDYLYHFDRIAKNNTYRWLCNRRKDKIAPCRSRIATMIPDAANKSQHIVVEVALGHVHPRCSDHEITKVTQRKRLSNMSMNNAYSNTQPKRARQYERATAGLNPPEWISTAETLHCDFFLDFEEKDRIYMLRRRDGRVMVCMDGHLYYLSGKSSKGDIYRWTCVRNRDIECSAEICTEGTVAGGHRLHPFESDAHLHTHYAAHKLMQMFARHQILLVDDDQINEVLTECPNLATFDLDCSLESQLKTEDCEALIIEEHEAYNDSLNMEDEEQVQEQTEQEAEVKWPSASDIIDNFVQPANYDALNETDLTKFTFLPSAKGRKVLCLDRHLFHFDSQSRANGNLFFSCIKRHDKQQSCHVRVTLDLIYDEPFVMRINGEHNHRPDLEELQQRIIRQQKLDSAHMSTEENNESELHFDRTDADELLETTEQPRSNVIMKKVIDIDGIRMEPEQHKTSPSMIVQYMNDGADNISAQIEILPNALHSIETATTSTPKPLLTNVRKRREPHPTSPQQDSSPTADMDLTKICTLRSAKGSEMLCVDGYIFYAKNRGLISRNYWVCIKSRDPEINCKSRISTATQKDGTIRVLRVYNSHSHPYSEDDIKRRLFNEINKKNNKKLKFRPLHFIGKSLDQIKQEFGDLAVERLNVSNLSESVVVHKKPRKSADVSQSSSNTTADARSQTAAEHRRQQFEEYEDDIEFTEEHEHLDCNADSELLSIGDNTDAIIEVIEEADIDNYSAIEAFGLVECKSWASTYLIYGIANIDRPIYTMKLYAVSDGPPSLAVRMALKALNIQYQLINVDFCALEHRTEDYAKMNPQKEIPVLDDDGFHLSESVAIMQYLCNKYAPLSTLYPEDPVERALVNQRLCFNMGFYYPPIMMHSMAPIFFDYERTPMTLKKVENGLDVFETYLQRMGTKYAAGENVTIADFALVASTLCLEAIDFDLTPYSQVKKWYASFKEEYPELWQIAESGMKEINAFEHNPPDLSQMEHPFHPTRKLKA
ncbi:gfzf [Drosophila busckii]|uniref:Gfzf n=2 Tax=Drosophila busckii TaxID=30019 RepID=A0A0M4EF00_DROBS|nr:gfzf [Drosophila busckii]